jgi:hypothetical protein
LFLNWSGAGTVEAVAATSDAAFCSENSAVQSDLHQLKFIDISLSNAAELGAAFEQLDPDVNNLASSAQGIATGDCS